MNLKMLCAEAHPDSGKEVVVVDEVDVSVCHVSINSISKRKERMGEE